LFWYSLGLTAQYLWTRSVNRSGAKSDFAYSGYNLNAYLAIPSGNSITKNVGSTSGTVCAGDDSRLTNSRKCDNTFDSASTARGNLGIRSATSTTALTGGSATEDITYTHNIGTKQNKVLVQITGVDSGEPADYLAMCPYDDTGNTTNDTIIRVSRVDGGNLGARTVRWTVFFIE
jgi:hypothetical protein